MRAVVLEPRHLDGLERLEKLCFAIPWSRASLREELCNPVARYVGLEDDEGCLQAYGGMYALLDEGHITNIAVAPERRREGLGERIMALLLAMAEREGLVFLTLEVRESNEAAQALYRKFGFTVAGRRRQYYDRPLEDALIMNLHPKRTEEA